MYKSMYENLQYPFASTLSGKKFSCLIPLAIVFTTLLIACDTQQLPLDAQLSISPKNRSIDIVDRRDDNGRCRVNPDNYIDEPLVLTLSGADGSPIGGKALSVYVDYAGNMAPSMPVLALYDDQRGNGNGVVDDESELVSGRSDSIARVRTNTLSGDRVLLLRINVSCPFRGDVFAFVDGVTASTDIQVNAVVEDKS